MPGTTVILGYDRAVAEWVRKRLPEPVVDDWGPCVALGIARGPELVAGVVFNNYHPPSIEASIASTAPNWCSRRNLALIFGYPFRQLRVTRLGALTAAQNETARRFLLRLGFRQEGIARKALSTGDAVIFGMTQDECRWLPPVLEEEPLLLLPTPDSDVRAWNG